MFRCRLLTALAVALTAAAAHAAYTTPGSGVDWTMDDLVAASGGVVTGSAGVYDVNDSVVIAVGDRLTVAPGASLTFHGGSAVGIEVNGALVAVGEAEAKIVFAGATAAPGAWRGLDYEDTGAGSEFRLAWCDIGWADIAVDVFGADVLVEDCLVHHCANRAFDFSSAGGVVRRCTIRDNQTRTITATLSSSPLIEGCWFENNNIANASPYPYINVGLQGTNSPTVRGCTIMGSGHHMSGGISIWAASSALIEGNRIEGCGYGILCYSTGANPTIRGNWIRDNTIHPDQVNWGFGVACNGSNAPIVAGNRITGHWYGVAAINGGRPNLGDVNNAFPGDDGGNLIFENGIGENIYGFYNNTPLAQMAQGNCWAAFTSQLVEDAIYHQVDDPTLGLVTFEPFNPEILDVPGTAPDALIAAARAWPNPFNPRVEIAFTLARPAHATLVVLDAAGRRVRDLHAGDLDAGEHAFAWDGADAQGRPLASGAYFFRLVAEGETRVGKLMLVR